MTTLENRIRAKNELHTFLNRVVPKLKEYIDTNGYSVKVNDELFKKDKIALTSLLGDIPFRAYVAHNYTRLYLKADITYSHGSGTSYYAREVSLEYPFTEIAMLDIEECNNLAIELAVLTNKRQDMQSRMYDIKRIIE